MCAGICRRKKKQINCFFRLFSFFYFLSGFIVGSFVIVAALKKERQKEAFDNLNRTQMVSNYFSLLFLFFLCVVCQCTTCCTCGAQFCKRENKVFKRHLCARGMYVGVRVCAH